ncbi:MAG: Holliday junction resolvase RuvX [Terriglobia bacterium]
MKERILAIDFGIRRLGIAVSDPLGVVALGLPTLERTNLASDLAWIGELIGEYGAGELIVGKPLSKSGEENDMSRRATGFAGKLRERLGCPVKLWDERLSSAEANRMLRGAGLGMEKRRRAVDRVAATLILQNYLDWRANQRHLESEVGDEA